MIAVKDRTIETIHTTTERTDQSVVNGRPVVYRSYKDNAFPVEVQGYEIVDGKDARGPGTGIKRIAVYGITPDTPKETVPEIHFSVDGRYSTNKSSVEAYNANPIERKPLFVASESEYSKNMLNESYKSAYGFTQNEVIDRYNDFVARGYNAEDAFNLAIGKDRVREEAEEVLRRAAESMEEMKLSYQPTLPLSEFEGIVYKEPEMKEPEEAAFIVPKEQLSFGNYLDSLAIAKEAKRRSARERAIVRRMEKYDPRDREFVTQYVQNKSIETQRKMQGDWEKFMHRAEYVPGRANEDYSNYAYSTMAWLIRRRRYKTGEDAAAKVHVPTKPGKIHSEIDALGRIGYRTSYSPEETESIANKARRKRLGRKEKTELSRQYFAGKLTNALRAVYEKKLEAEPFKISCLPVKVFVDKDLDRFGNGFARNPTLSALRFASLYEMSDKKQAGTELDRIFRGVLEELGTPETQEDFNTMLDLTYEEFLREYDLKSNIPLL